MCFRDQRENVQKFECFSVTFSGQKAADFGKIKSLPAATARPFPRLMPLTPNAQFLQMRHSLVA